MRLHQHGSAFENSSVIKFACMVHEMDEACSTRKVLPVHAIKAYGKSKIIYR